MNARLTLTTCALALALAGCSSVDSDNHGKRMLIPAKNLNVSPSLSIPAEGIALGVLAYYIIDPLAPNWKVQVEPLGPRRYRLDLEMKRFITGGEGEAAQVVRRTAEQLRRDGGFSDWTLVAMTEGIESRVPVAQRVAHALIELR